MKRLIILLLLLSFALGASAQTLDSYTLSPRDIDMEALKTLAFGEDKDKATREDRTDDILYQIDKNGPPFAGLGKGQYHPQQSSVSVVKLCSLKQRHEEGVYDNVVPTGIASMATTREQALQTAQDAMALMGLDDHVLQSITAYGRRDFLAPSYKVAFGQTLHGLPIYWAAQDNADQTFIDSNRVQITIGDCGLYRIQGDWSAFTPAGKPAEILTEQQALAAFHALHIPADKAELCYLLDGTAQPATATPAWRYRNSFIHAGTGIVMQ